MILLKDIREDLEKYKDFQIVYNLTSSGASYYDHSYNSIEELLKYPDSYELPYECYEVIYDWDDWGYGDGKDSICFYYHSPGFFERNKRLYKGYSKEFNER